MNALGLMLSQKQTNTQTINKVSGFTSYLSLRLLVIQESVLLVRVVDQNKFFTGRFADLGSLF